MDLVRAAAGWGCHRCRGRDGTGTVAATLRPAALRRRRGSPSWRIQRPGFPHVSPPFPSTLVASSLASWRWGQHWPGDQLGRRGGLPCTPGGGGGESNPRPRAWGDREEAAAWASAVRMRWGGRGGGGRARRQGRSADRTGGQSVGVDVNVPGDYLPSIRR